MTRSGDDVARQTPHHSGDDVARQTPHRAGDDVPRQTPHRAGDDVPRQTAPRSGDETQTESGRKWHAAVLAAASRTTHELPATTAPRDPRYGSPDPDTDRLWQALAEVADPELPISLVDLGLICDVRRTGSAVEVDLTFTASACPCMEFIIEDVRTRLLHEPDVEQVAVRDVWDPPWTSARMTEHGRALLRSFGVAA
jgi:metal-sulfur cluster biosynthetic enzyme